MFIKVKLNETQLEALRLVNQTPRTPSDIGAQVNTLQSLERRGLIFSTSEGLYYTQGRAGEMKDHILQANDIPSNHAR